MITKMAFMSLFCSFFNSDVSAGIKKISLQLYINLLF